jgi:hypothetical protein
MSAEAFIERLATRGRVLMLGGLAVIAHGLARSTRDVDVWLEPFATANDWAVVLREILADVPVAYPFDLRRRRPVDPLEIEPVVVRDGVIRVGGLDRNLDVFRVPHNLSADDFDAVWHRAEVRLEHARVPDEIDLLVTKEDTSRPQDMADIAFLEEKIRQQLSATLSRCTLEEAEEIFRRYADHATCTAALQNPNEPVRRLAMATLREFADAGDPFAQRMLAETDNEGDS